MAPSWLSRGSRTSRASGLGDACGSVCLHWSGDGSGGGQASHEPATKGLKELRSAIETWELQLNASPRLEIAAFMQLLSNDIQEIVFWSTGTTRTYEEVREKAKGLVCNRLAVNSGAAAMDLVTVQEEEYWLERATIVRCSEQLAKAPCAMRAAAMAMMPDIVLTSVQPRPSGQARAKEKERPEETAKGGTTFLNAQALSQGGKSAARIKAVEVASEDPEEVGKRVDGRLRRRDGSSEGGAQVHDLGGRGQGAKV